LPKFGNSYGSKNSKAKIEGKKATSARKYDIEAKGAICSDKPVERDGNIITANGPGAARQFGEAIVYALSE
jgi:putative intracellular protease/amidase